MTLSFIQVLFILAMILMVVGMCISMLLLTWALISPKAIISTRKAGIWIMFCLIGASICYMILAAVS